MKCFHFKKYFSLIIILFFAIPLFAGGSGVGNVKPGKVTLTAIQNIIENESFNLKTSMLNYMNTVKVNAITHEQVKNFFVRTMANGDLKKDILESKYYYSKSCGEENKLIAAQADVGGVGKAVCFNDEKLFETYKDLSVEEVYIKIASIAFHEHAHHFQKTLDENEAYNVSAYVLVTAKFVQVPLLRWSQNANENYNKAMTALRDELLTQEMIISTIKEIEAELGIPLITPLLYTSGGMLVPGGGLFIGGLITKAGVFVGPVAMAYGIGILAIGAIPAVLTGIYSTIYVTVRKFASNIDTDILEKAGAINQDIEGIHSTTFMYQKSLEVNRSFDEALHSVEINNLRQRINQLASESSARYCKPVYSFYNRQGMKCHKAILLSLGLDLKLSAKKITNYTNLIDIQKVHQ